MCMYCEENEIFKSANFCGSAKAKILGHYLDLYGDEKKFNIFKRIYRPSFNINYCPMCRKEAGRVRVMISQPMANRSEEDIMQERKAIIEKFNNMHIDVIDTIFTDEVPIDYNAGVYYLGKSILEMSKVDALFMCDGWREARGCRIEYQVAQDYGIKILYEDFFVNKPELNTRTI